MAGREDPDSPGSFHLSDYAVESTAGTPAPIGGDGDGSEAAELATNDQGQPATEITASSKRERSPSVTGSNDSGDDKDFEAMKAIKRKKIVRTPQTTPPPTVHSQVYAGRTGPSQGDTFLFPGLDPDTQQKIAKEGLANEDRT